MTKNEFDPIARYFVHSSRSVSKVFEQFSPGADDNLLQLLDSVSDQQLNDHMILNTFKDIFTGYFHYIQNCEKKLQLPLISSEMDGASVYAKAVIRNFRSRMQSTDLLIQDKWLTSYYASFPKNSYEMTY